MRFHGVVRLKDGLEVFDGATTNQHAAALSRIGLGICWECLSSRTHIVMCIDGDVRIWPEGSGDRVSKESESPKVCKELHAPRRFHAISCFPGLESRTKSDPHVAHREKFGIENRVGGRRLLRMSEHTVSPREPPIWVDFWVVK
jgi:hypothetical protein